MDWHYLIVAPVFLLMVTLLVAAHEYGHYLFAKLNGMDVEEFAIGFGKKPLWVWMRKPQPRRTSELPKFGASELRNLGTSDAPSSGEGSLVERALADDSNDTKFTIRPLPLGGFVRIKGMMPEEDGSETLVPNGFYSKSPARRLTVLFAGPLFSVLAGMLVLVVLFGAVGQETFNERPIISGVLGNSVAERGGLRAGDEIVAIDGKPITKWFQMTNIVRAHGGQPLTFTIQRDHSQKQLTIVPALSPDEQPANVDDQGHPFGNPIHIGQVGARPSMKYVQMPFGQAVRESIMAPLGMIAGLFSIFQHPSQFSQNMGGPISMVAVTSEATRSGPYEVILLAGMLSISLGILNLLPVPPLDGGQILVALAEMFRRGRRLSIQVQNVVNSVGLALVGMLILSVLWVDVKRFIFRDPAEMPQVSAPTRK